MSSEISDTSIHASRSGYLYQDLFTMFTYFENYLSDDFQELCIDYPYGKKQFSIDVYKICSGELEVYEVKNGENFKQDEDEIKITMHNFYEFSKTFSPVSMTLIISPELRSKVAEYWIDIQNLSRYRILNSGAGKRSAERLTKKLSIPELNKPELIHRFIRDKCIKIDVSLKGYTDNYSSSSQLEKHIVISIDQIANLLRTNACDFELPSEYLLYEILQVVPRFAGTAQNLKMVLDEKVIAFMARRLLLDSYRSPSSRGDNLSKAEEEVKNRVDKIKLGESVITPVASKPGVIR